MPTTDNESAMYLAKARESLAAAESDYREARYNSCANLCYYACFQAAVTALIHEQIRPTGRWTHKYVLSQFSGQLINRRKRYSGELRQTLPNNLAVRRLADYSTTTVSRSTANRALASTRIFVQEIVQRTE